MCQVVKLTLEKDANRWLGITTREYKMNERVEEIRFQSRNSKNNRGITTRGKIQRRLKQSRTK